MKLSIINYNSESLASRHGALLAQDTATPTEQPENEFLYRHPGDLAEPGDAFNLIGDLASNLLTLAIFAGALIALGFFVVGAIQWGTAASGDGAEKGRKTMTFAAFGLVMLGVVYIVIMLYNAILPTAG